jgi:RNA polymerase sigma-70 factor (ECF subfamily)
VPKRCWFLFWRETGAQIEGPSEPWPNGDHPTAGEVEERRAAIQGLSPWVRVENVVPSRGVDFSHLTQKIFFLLVGFLLFLARQMCRRIVGTFAAGAAIPVMSDTGLFHEPMLRWKDLLKSDDEELISELVKSNHDALAVIVDSYQQLVLTVARRIVRDESEAEEVAQTVFMEVFRRPAQFDARRGTLKMWLLQFAYSRSINRRTYLESRRFYSQVDLETAEQCDRSTAPPGRLSCGETARLVRQALRVLNDKQRRAIDLVYFEGLTLEEAAHKAGETQAATRHHYYRGLMKLRQFIQSSNASGKEAIGNGLRLEMADADPRPI